MKLVAPNNEKKVLLHTCCAPCAGSLIEMMQKAGIEVTLFYYNPNIYPHEEYIVREKESETYANTMKIPFVRGRYTYDLWQENIKGYEKEPERGKRCTLCFLMRMDELAKYAYENDYKVITSSLGISRWKNLEEITRCGTEAAKLYPDITYWNYNWRKQGGSQRMYEIAKHNHFYKQEYCGCEFSLTEANQWREKNQKAKIEIPLEKQSTKDETDNDNLNRY